MGIDPRIPLMYKSPEIPDFAEQQRKVLELQNLRQQQEAQRQILEQNRIKIQQQQQAQRENDILRRIYTENKGDLAATLEQAQGQVSPETYLSLDKEITEQRKSKAVLKADEFKNQTEANELTAQLLANVKDDATWKQAVMTGWQKGIIDQDTAGDYIQRPYDKNFVDGLIHMTNSGKQLLEWGKFDREARKFETEMRESKTKERTGWAQSAAQLLGSATDQNTWDRGLQTLAFFGAPKDLIDLYPKQYSPGTAAEILKSGVTAEKQYEVAHRELPVEKMQMEDWLKKNPGKGPSDYVTWKALNSSTILQTGIETPALTGTTREEQLAQVPSGLRGLVGQMLDYRGIMPSGFALSRPPWTQVFNYVAQIDPKWDVKEFPMRQKMMNSFTSGQDAKELEAINTVSNHIGVLGDAVSALKNKDITAINTIANAWGVYIKGASPVTQFTAIVNRVGPEITRAYVGTGGEFSERKQNEGDFRPTMSPQQILDNVKITAQLLQGKIDSKKSKWKTGMDREEFSLRPGGPSFITTAAQQVFDKYAPASKGNAGGIKIRDPKTGKTGTFAGTAEEAKALGLEVVGPEVR